MIFVMINYDDCYDTEGDAYADTDEKRLKNFVKSQFKNWTLDNEDYDD